MNELRKTQFSKIYAPANALFLTRHITTASSCKAPYFRQRFRNARNILFQEIKAIEAFQALFDKQELEEIGEVEYGGSFPLRQITEMVNSNCQYADSELTLLVSKANRSQYEEAEGNELMTKAELKLFYHIVDRYQKLSHEYADV